MKREILFRGLYDGNWVYGTYHYSADNKHHYILAREKLLVHDGGYMALHDKEVWQVQPETVGQYTGIKDKNGRKIFEGDIVKFHHFYDGGGVELEEEFKAKVEIREVGVYLVAKESHNYILNYYGVHEESFEVIGDIHENPELL